MMALAPSLGREAAHDRVYAICREVVSSGRPLLDLLAEDPEITAHLDRDALARLCDPSEYLGRAGEMVDHVVSLHRRSNAQ
jgi:3-carboxy-cis,cis-muconate cycloisomerase